MATVDHIYTPRSAVAGNRAIGASIWFGNLLVRSEIGENRVEKKVHFR